MSERERWLPTDDEIHLHLIHKGGIRFISDYCRIVRDLLRATVEQALAEQERKVRRATLQEAARAVCHGCCEMDYNPLTQDHREQINDHGDFVGGPCFAIGIHDLIAALEEEADDAR